MFAVTLRGAGAIVRIPGTREIAYFVELKPEQVMGYVPAELVGVAVVWQLRVPVRTEGVSPAAKPLYVTLFNGGVALPYCCVALPTVIVSSKSAAAETSITTELETPL